MHTTKSSYVSDTTAAKEPITTVEILMDDDCLESHDDRYPSVVVLRDKGKQVDPREYGGAICNPLSTTVLTDTDSTTTSGRIELVGVHGDKGKNVDPRELRRNRVAKYKPGPSRIDFSDYRLKDDSLESTDFHKLPMQSLPSLEPAKFTDLTSCRPLDDPGLPRLRWHPKISPYRLIVFSIPVGIGTAKAISSQKGNVTVPITLEWTTGVVVFLV